METSRLDLISDALLNTYPASGKARCTSVDSCDASFFDSWKHDLSIDDVAIALPDTKLRNQYRDISNSNKPPHLINEELRRLFAQEIFNSQNIAANSNICMLLNWDLTFSNGNYYLWGEGDWTSVRIQTVRANGTGTASNFFEGGEIKLLLNDGSTGPISPAHITQDIYQKVNQIANSGDSYRPMAKICGRPESIWWQGMFGLPATDDIAPRVAATNFRLTKDIDIVNDANGQVLFTFPLKWFNK